jgi:stage V sporulation protein B
MENNIPKGTIRITLANALQYIILALFYIVITKTNALSQEEIGTLSILSFLASAFTLFTLLSLPTALTKFISEQLGKKRKREATAIQKTVIKTAVTLSIIGFIICSLSSQVLSQYFWNNPEFTILLILNFTYAFISNLTTLSNSILQALYHFGNMATITITFMVTSRVIAIILALLDMGVIGVTIGYIVGSILALIIAIYFLHGKLDKATDNVPMKPIFAYSIPLFLTSITNLIINWADIVIITSLTGDLSLTGIYHIAINSVGALSILYIPITTTIFPALSSHYGLKKPKNISNILKITSRFLLYLLIPSCIGLAIVAPTALSLFYGPTYAKGAIALAILSITTFLIALVTLFTTTFQAIGKTGQILKINMITAIILIITLLPLVTLLDITGAAFARLITKVVAIILSVYLLNKEMNINIDKEALWKSSLSTILTIPFLLVFELILSPNLSTLQTLAFELLVAAGIYALGLYALKALTKQDFQLLKQAFPKPLTKYINIFERLLVR